MQWWDDARWWMLIVLGAVLPHSVGESLTAVGLRKPLIMVLSPVVHKQINRMQMRCAMLLVHQDEADCSEKSESNSHSQVESI